MNRTTRIKITELNPHVICVLCGGYFINATTITECLHSFCRTCITHYLNNSKYCPVCDVMVHKTRPLDYIRSDKTLQDLVYKLIPGLYKSEMKRRREYYAEVDHTEVSKPPSEDRGDEFHDRIIYTEDEKISLSLELCAEGIPFKTPTNVHGHNGLENIKKNDVRYLQCPAAFSIGNLKKFIRMKFDLKLKYEIDIFHTAEPLPDYYSLMDIAYIYTWTRRTPLRLYYTVFERKLAPWTLCHIPGNQSKNIPNQTEEKKETYNDVGKDMQKNVREKAQRRKRKLLADPDDICSSKDLEKPKARNQERNKTGTHRRRVKKTVVEDDLVLERMSESEEQLAKLTLNSSGDGKKLVGTYIRTAFKKTPIDDDITSQKSNESFNVKIVEIIEGQCANLARNGVITDNQDSDGEVNVGSHPSTGCGLVRHSLLKPLNSTCDIHSESRAKTGSLYDFADVEAKVVKQNESPEKQGSSHEIKIKITNDTNKETSVSAKKLRESRTNLVISKNHPGLNSLKQKKIRKKLANDNERGVVEISTPKKLNKTVAKWKMEKAVPNDGDHVKRKYVMKDKSEKAKNNGTAKNNDNEIKVLSKETNSNSAQDSSLDVVKKTTDGKSNTDCSVNKSNEMDLVCYNKAITGTDETIENVNDISEQQSDNDRIPSKTSEQDGTQQNLFEQPTTPLYGQIPKVDESNQGLPHSPNTNHVHVTNNETTDGERKTCVVNGAITNGSASMNVDDTGQQSVFIKNVDYPSSCYYANSLQPVVSVYQNQVAHGFRYLDAHNSHFEMFRNSLNAFSPNSVCMFSQNMYSPSPVTAHASHLTNGLAYAHTDTNCDQPLDLTNNNGHRDEYAKGKIFKTKLLKRSLPKQEIVHSSREKTNVPSSNGLKPSGH